MYKIDISDDADNDIATSREYYEEKQKGLGKRFFNAVLNALGLIQKNPYTYQEIDNDLRRYVMKKFPFVILYFVGEVVIQIIAVFHTSRNPNEIQKRFNIDNEGDE